MSKLTALEEQLDSKDQTIAELKKKVMVQEEAITSWIEAMDEKKKALRHLQFKADDLAKEND
jgi:uncharacterized coiled-coil protein SlyX